MVIPRSLNGLDLRGMRTALIPTVLTVLLYTCAPAEEHEGVQAVQEEVGVLHSPPDSLYQRWEVNDATREGVKAMRSLVSDGADVTGLKEALVNEMALIFERCTMTGEGHEHLHDYLLPLLTMAQALPDTASAQDVQAIRSHLARFEEEFR